MLVCNSTCLEYFLNDEKPLARLGRMAAKVSFYNFEWRFDTLVIFNYLHLMSLEAYLKWYNKAIIVKKGKFIPARFSRDKFRPHVPQFVIFGENTSELQDMMEWLMKYNYDNTAKFIIVCATKYYHLCDNQPLYETLLKRYISNVVFLKLSDGDVPEAYTPIPLKPHRLCWSNELEKTDIVHGCPNEDCYKNAFPQKFNNLYKCELKISTFEQPPYMYLKNGTDGVEVSGGDGDIMKLVANLINATLIVMTPVDGPEWGHFENHNWTGSLGDVFNDRAHASMCSSPLTNTKYGNFQISFTYDSMDMVWVAPMPAFQPHWKKLLYPFPFALRIILIFMFLGIVVLTTLARTQFCFKIMRVMKIVPWRSNLLIYSWVLFLGMPVTKLPHRMSFRILVYSWIWYCCIIRCVYQATLISSLKMRAFEDKIENFSEVLRNNNPFGGLSSLREYYSDDREVYEKWIPVSQQETRQMLDKMSTGETDFVLALNKELAIEHFLQYNGTRQIQIIPQKLVNSPMVIYFKKNSHLTLPISKILTILLEGGFTQRLYAKYVMYVKLLFRQEKSHEAEPLKMEHFTGSFVLLFLGCGFSCVFFAIEFACGRK